MRVFHALMKLYWRYVRFNTANINANFAVAELQFKDPGWERLQNCVGPCPVRRKFSVTADEVAFVEPH